MKKVLFIIVCAMGVVSCEIKGGTKIGTIGDYSIREIEGCEYIEYKKGAGETAVYSITHKGNCKNHEKF